MAPFFVSYGRGQIQRAVCGKKANCTVAHSRARLELMRAQLAEFRKYLVDSDLANVLTLYPALMEKKFLGSRDTLEIMRLLHYRFRQKTQLVSDTDIEMHVKEFVKRLQLRQLPPHSSASTHVLSYFKRSGQFDAGLDYWNWVVKQDSNYLNLATYGAAIELLAIHGQGLAFCEEVYVHGLKRFASNFNEYHMSSNAIAKDRHLPTSLPGTSMSLLQGIIKARLIYGDWRKGYLGLDTALRLHPTQCPALFMRGIYTERPVSESFQVFRILSQSGNSIPPSNLTFLLGHITAGQAKKRCNIRDRNLMLAALSAIHYSIGSRQRLNNIHLEVFLQGILDLFPVKGLDEGRKAFVHDLITGLISRIVLLFGSKGVPPNEAIFIEMLGLAGISRNKSLLQAVAVWLQENDTSPSLAIMRSLLLAARDIGDATQLELFWNSWKHIVSSQPDLWVLLANAAVTCGNVCFVRQQVMDFKIPNEKEVLEALESPQPNEVPELEMNQAERDSMYQALMEAVDTLTSEVARIQELARTKDIYNLHDHPPCRPSILPFTSSVSEEWQRKLYDDLNTDPASRASAVDLESGGSEEHAAQNSKAPEAVLTATGFRLDELRYENWKAINELLCQAQLFEARWAAAVLEALDRGESMKRTRSPRPRTKRGLLHKALDRELTDLEEDMNNKAVEERGMTETEWRAKVLDLRRAE
jgi:hypothetical protein